MHVDPEESDNAPIDRVSPDLITDLGAIYRTPVTVTPALDERILRDAERNYMRHRSRMRIYRIGALVSAAAAMLAIVVHLNQSAAPETVAMSDSQTQPNISIVDALKLAKRIRTEQTDPARDDINRDGAVDQRDIDTLAMAVVKLPEVRVQ